MNIKIWIGDNAALREMVMAMIDVGSYGGRRYFETATSVYIYNDKPEGYDVRANSREGDGDRAYFDEHPNMEVKLVF